MKKEIRDSEYLSLLRLVAILFIIWAHYEYQVYALYAGTNLEMQFFFPPSKGAYLFYGWTGKYALGMLCVVSGYLGMMQCEKGKTIRFFPFALKRYIRLLLPITGTGLLYVVLDLFTNRNFTWKDILSGLFLLGSSAFDQHVFAIMYFFLGNLLVVLFYRITGRHKIGNMILQIMVAGIMLVAVLKRWRMIDAMSHEQIMQHQLLLTVYNENWTWIAATLLGAASYTWNQWLHRTLKGRWHWVFMILIIPIYILPRGEEGFLIWTRDIVACICLITLIEQTGCKDKINQLSASRICQQLMPLSYSMFVTHGIVNSAITQPLVSGMLQAGWNQMMVYVVGLLVMAAGVFLLSKVIHQLWENTLYRLIR